MVKARQCLIISLTIHILAAILIGQFVVTPTVKRRVMPSAMRISRHSDELLIEILAAGFLKRHMVVREAITPPEVTEIQLRPLDSVALSLPEAGYKIPPAMPEEEVFLPVIWTPMIPQESVLEPISLYVKRIEIMERGAGKHLRTVYIGPTDYVIFYRDDLVDMARNFILALIEKDYEKAHEIAGKRYPASRFKGSGYGTMTEIVSIDEPYLLRSAGMSAEVGVFCQMKLMAKEVIGREIVIAMPLYTIKDGWYFEDIYSVR